MGNFLILQTLNGLTIGCIFILLASGLTIVFGLQGIVNVAHGVFYMLGAYLAITLLPFFKNFWLALIVGFGFNFLLGCLLEITAIRTLVRWKRPGLHVLVFTLGLGITFRELVKITWGPIPQLTDVPSFLQGAFSLGPIDYPVFYLFIIAFTAIILTALGFFFTKTGIGILVQSIALNSEMTQALGTNAPRINTLIFGLGTGIAGIAGVISGPILGVEPNMCFDLLILLFVIIIFGGMGSLLGAVISGIIIGLVIAFGTVLLTGMIAKILAFVVMIAILVIRPLGLFGRAGILVED